MQLVELCYFQRSTPGIHVLNYDWPFPKQRSHSRHCYIDEAASVEFGDDDDLAKGGAVVAPHLSPKLLYGCEDGPTVLLKLLLSDVREKRLEGTERIIDT